MNRCMPARTARRPVALAIRLALAGVVPALSFIAAPPAFAQTPATAQQSQHSFDIAAGALGATLTRIAEQGGVLLSFEPKLVEGLSAPAVRGTMTAHEALQRALSNSGLEIVSGSNGGWRLQRSAAVTLSTVKINAGVETTPTALPPAYAGGQVATGARLGMLGNRDVLDTPFNISSYTVALIENQQAKTISDVVANDASVRNLLAGGAETDHFIIRGFVLQAQDVAFGGLYGIAPAQVAMENVERVEVLKGPNALLGGMTPNGNVGGGINVVAKRAAPTPLSRVKLEYTNDSQFGVHADVGRRFGEDSQFGVRINVASRDGEIAVDDTDQKQDFISAGLDWRGERARVEADFVYQEQRTDRPPRIIGFNPDADVPSAPEAGSNAAQAWEYAEYTDYYGVLRGEYDITDAITAYAAAGYASAEAETLYANQFVSNGDGDFNATPYWYPTDSTNVSLQAGVSGEITTGAVTHQWNLMASKLDSDSGYLFETAGDSFDSNLHNPLWYAEPTAPRPTDVHTTSNTELESVGLSDTLSINNGRAQLTLGVRRQNVETDQVDPAGEDYEEHAYTPSFAVLIKPWDGVSLYGNYIEGLSKGPTAPEEADNAGKQFAPYKSKQYEVGAKFDGGSFTVTTALFQIEQPSGRLDADTNLFDMDGNQRHRGIELNVFGEPTSGSRLLGGVMLLDPELTNTQGGANDGNNPNGVPELQANIGGEYDLKAVAGLTLTARAIYTDKQYLDVENVREIPSWTRVDLGARQKFAVAKHPVVVRANLTNAFNRDYWSSSYYGMNQGGPRTLIVSATVDF